MSGAGWEQPVVRSERGASLLDKDTASGTFTQANGTDMQGYDRAAFDIIIGLAVNGAVFNAWLVESNESNLGNATNIQKAANSSVQIKQTATTASANQNNTVRTLEVFRPRKRYVGVSGVVTTQNITTLSIVSRKWRGSGVTPGTTPTDHEYIASAAYTA